MTEILKSKEISFLKSYNKTTYVDKFKSLSVWSRNETRAPHKPLLILLSLGLFRHGIRKVSYKEYENKITELLFEFGPNRTSIHPEYPFWRLQNDGVWIVESQRPMRSKTSNNDIPRTELREANAIGYFPDPLQQQLVHHPKMIWTIAQLLLEAHFPPSLHEEILNAVGLPYDVTNTSYRRRRNPNFRITVLSAYSNQCAVCGFDLKIGSFIVGLEAVHIKWHQANGPDTTTNGIALCSLHHKLFDFGAFTLTSNFQILVSDLVTGTSQLNFSLSRHHMKLMSLPLEVHHHPSLEFVEWHRREVFKCSDSLLL